MNKNITHWENIVCDRTEKDCTPIHNCLLKRFTDLPHRQVEHTHYLNGSICKHPHATTLHNGYSLYAYRTQQEPHFLHTLVHVCAMKGHIPVGQHFTFKPRPPSTLGEKLQWKMVKKNQPTANLWRAEDPRLVVHDNKFYMVFTDGWKIGYVMLDVEMDSSGLTKCDFMTPTYPPSPRLTMGKFHDGREKNWSPISYEGDLWVLYSFQPLVFYRLRDGKTCTMETSIFDSWKYGTIKGGTPLVRMNNGDYLTIFHSTIRLAGGYTVYTGGALVLDSHLAPKRISRYPIIAPCIEHDEYSYLKNTWVIFPSGIIREDNVWKVSCGINDHSTSLLYITDEMLEHNLTFW